MEQRIKLLQFDLPDKNRPTAYFSSYSYETVVGYISEENINRYKKLYKENKENKLNPNTKVYLSPLAEFPSFKLKNYIEENQLNIKIIRKINEIDSIIINHEFISSSYTNDLKRFYIVPLELLETPNIIKYFNPKYGWSDPRRFTLNSGEVTTVTHFYLEEKEYLKMIAYDSNFSFINDLPLITGNIILNTWGKKKISDNLPNFINLFNIIDQHNVNVIFDYNINNETNKGLSIDNDTFENIINMLNSDDESNFDIAKEVLANMEFDSSKPYLIYLFNYFWQLKSNKLNNKNYDYLKKHMKKLIYMSPSKNYPTTFNDFLPKMITQHPEYSQIFMDCFRIHMNILFKKEIIKEITV